MPPHPDLLPARGEKEQNRVQVPPPPTLGYDVGRLICLNKRIGDMNDSATVLAQNGGQTGEDDILQCDVSDATLEKAATAIPGGALSFPNAPTVSIIVICCSFD